MGDNARATVTVGPFRYNITEAGVTVTLGETGLPFSPAPRGYLIVTGLQGWHYSATWPLGAQPTPSQPGRAIPQRAPLQVSTADTLLAELNAKANQVPLWKWGAAGLLTWSVIGELRTAYWVAVLAVIILYVYDRFTRTTVLCFSLDGPAERAYEQLKSALANLASAGGLWTINLQGASLSQLRWLTPDSSAPLKVELGLPPGVRGNIHVPVLKSPHFSLYFCPDRVLVHSKHGFQAVDYAELNVSGVLRNFVEMRPLPPDAEVVGHTWVHCNNNGWPDRRFKHNPSYPLVHYEQVHLSSGAGLDEIIMSSRKQVTPLLSDAIAVLRQVSASLAEPMSPESVPSPLTVAVPRAEAIEEEPLVSFTLNPEAKAQEVAIPSPPPTVSSVRPVPMSVSDKFAGRWIPPGETLTFGDYLLPGGMLYYGRAPKTEAWRTEASLIDPALPVEWEPAVDIAYPLGYWPRYSEMSPRARRTYLLWLAGGRSQPDVDVGYVFLFFYGLERRALVDTQTDPAAQRERPLLVAEVQRLLSIYGHHLSFKHFAQDFIEYLTVNPIEEKRYLTPPPGTEPAYELPLSYRVALGQVSADQAPLSAEWALAWTVADKKIAKHTPCRRCPALFAKVFKQCYRQTYGEGFLLPVNRTPLKVSYFPAASPSLRGLSIKQDVGGLPDVSPLKKPIRKLQAIVETAIPLIDAYSRFVGRYPDRADTLEGALLLPPDRPEWWPLPVRSGFEYCRKKAEHGMRILPLNELLSRLRGPGTLSLAKWGMLSRMLEAYQLGLEPDMAFCAAAPKGDASVVLFTTGDKDGQSPTTSACYAASVTFDLACAVAMADGTLANSRLEFLLRQIEAWPALSLGHQQRLKARLQLQRYQPTPMANIKKKLEPLTPDAKRALGQLLAHLMQSTGVVGPSDVKLLEGMYKLLQLDGQLLYSDLHAAPLPGTTRTSRPASPPDPARSPAGVNLDMARIAELQKESEQVSTLLASVFSEEPLDQTFDTAPPSPEEEVPGLLELDPPHSDFLRLLITRPEWSRAELMNIAQDRDLLLDGAVECINEAAFEHLEALLIDGEDPLCINQELLERLQA